MSMPNPANRPHLTAEESLRLQALEYADRNNGGTPEVVVERAKVYADFLLDKKD